MPRNIPERAQGGDAQEHPWGGRGEGIAWEHPEVGEGTERGCPGVFPGEGEGTGKGFLGASRGGHGQGVPRDFLGWARAWRGAALPRSRKSKGKAEGCVSPLEEHPEIHLEEAGQGWEGQQSGFGDQKPPVSSALTPPATTIHDPGMKQSPPSSGWPRSPVVSPG